MPDFAALERIKGKGEAGLSVFASTKLGTGAGLYYRHRISKRWEATADVMATSKLGVAAVGGVRYRW